MDRYEELAATFARVADVTGVRDEGGVLRGLADACGWGTRSIDAPLLPSGVRHGVPYGISFVVGAGAPEVRVFVEPQAEPASLAAYREASARVADFIAAQPGADVERLVGVREPFARIWYAVAFRPDAAPAYRAYLCLGEPQRERRPTVERTLSALGVTQTVDLGQGDVPTMVGLDLHASPRIKLYAFQEKSPDHPFADAMPSDEHPISWLWCHFLESSPPRVAWHYSAPRHVRDDDDVEEALLRFLESERIDASVYRRMRNEVPFRHHFVTYQRIGDAPRVTVYLLPEVKRT